MNWNSFRFIDLFAGIGGIRLGFESVGGKCVFSSEFDEDACKTYEANFGEHPSGDITKIEASSIPDFDILLGGFPCQAFSIIGKKEGFANETCGTLFFDIERILKEKRPKAFMLENVRNLVAHDKGNTFRVIRSHLEALGYNVYAKVLNALDYGVPQKRERIIIVGFLDDVLFSFPDPIPKEKRKTLSDILEKNVDSKYYVKDSIRESRLSRLKDPNYPKPYISHENMAGSITPHPYSAALRAGASANYILINDERRPTEREMLRIQGFPETFKIVVSYSQLRHQCGNSVAVPVIKAVAKSMINSLKNSTTKMANEIISKNAIDKIINKSRVHLYKPIQIAEILYRDRVHGDIDLSKLDTYRNASKRWRDMICVRFVGRTSTSSAKFQDNLFEDNAIPPTILTQLGEINRNNNGLVEAYIYRCFANKFTQMNAGLDYCRTHDKSNFMIRDFINIFWYDKGLRRSVDKIYEIVVYALFSALVECMKVQITVSMDQNKRAILEEFADFAERVIGITPDMTEFTVDAKINRVGVTNAADRGLDMWANFGMAIQIKHLSLTEELAEEIVSSVSSDRIVIVCKDSEQRVIVSLLNQIGWKSKIQSIVTENDLVRWYEKALRGTFANEMGDRILTALRNEIQLEFPATDKVDFNNFLTEREYDKIPFNGIWSKFAV